MITNVRNVKVHTNGSLANEDYHKMGGISSSGLYRLFTYCPAKFKYGEQEETAALHFGTASHAAMLEPELFKSEFVRGIDPSDYEEIITNASDAKSAMKKDGVIMTMADAKKAIKEIGGMVSSSDVKKQLASKGIKVVGKDGKASTAAEDVIETWMEKDKTGILFVPPAGAELADVAEELVKVIPDARVYVGGDDAESLFEGIDILCPHIHVLKNIEKKLADKHQGATIIKPDDYDIIQKMRAKLFQNEQYANMVSGAFYETSIICEVQVEGSDEWIKVKARPDMITKGRLVPDYKTTRDVRPEEFGRHAYNGGYWFRQAFVCDILSIVYGQEFRPALLAQEKDAPYIPQLYVMTDEQIEYGRTQYMEALLTYAQCVKTNVWPAYSGEALPLDTPAWVK